MNALTARTFILLLLTSNLLYPQTPIGPAELVAPAVVISGDNVNLTVRNSVSGRRYQLQGSLSMTPGSWVNLGAEKTGNGGNLVFTTPYDPVAPRRYYWIVLDPAPPLPPYTFALISAGSFQMGDTFSANPAAAHVIRTVSVSAFQMGKYEVCKALWDEVRAWGLSQGYTDLPVGAAKGPGHPVHSINWYAMVKWCNARSEKNGLTPCYTASGATYKSGINEAVVCVWGANGYRLPTEAEWEKAERGGFTGKRFPWGDMITHNEANYRSDSFYAYDISATRGYHPSYIDGTVPYTSPVGSFAPNSYGLYDMVGNVWEWCWDRKELTSEYVAATPDPRGPDTGPYRMGRGGQWSAVAGNCVAWYRSFSLPTSTGNYIGFRMARSGSP